MSISTINPATGELVKEYQAYSPTKIESILDACENAFPDWQRTSYETRAELMNKAAGHLRDNKQRLADLITLEMGKPVTQSVAEIEKCILVCEYYATNAEEFLTARAEQSDADHSYVRYDPLGPVLAVMPWNFPFWQVFRFAAPALMAGNVGLLKHASNVPACALEIENIFRRTGFPEGVFSTLLIGGSDVASIIRDRRIKAATLTGSEVAGKSIASTAGEVLKKTVLELGGSDPFIVLGDADIERAAKVGATARNINSGQSCIAAKRFIVVAQVADSFREKFTAALSALKMGDPTDEKTDVGPMARGDLRDDLHRQVIETQKQGARIALGGEIPTGKGYYYPVTLLTEVKPEMIAAEEETFGPAAALLVAENESQAIEIANRSTFGLGSSLWTADLDRAHYLAKRIEAGAVFVNGLVKSDPRLPFGGIKRSGYGRELSREGIREFVNIKTVWMKG